MKKVSTDINHNIILAHIHNRLADIDAALRHIAYGVNVTPRYINVDLEHFAFYFNKVLEAEKGEDENAG